MRPPSAQEIIGIWEQAQFQHPLERALTIATAAWPGVSRSDLARLPLGALHAGLLRLHESTFGDRLRARANCPHCRAQLEFEMAASALGRADEPSTEPGERDVQAADIRMRFRVPDSFDLATAARCPTPEQARLTLIERCIVAAEREGTPVPPAELPPAAIEMLSQQITAADPRAELLIDLDCASCGHRWQSVLDVGAFLWVEIAAHARRLLREVHALARAYGWSEAQILALSDRRRAAYLELVGGLT